MQSGETPPVGGGTGFLTPEEEAERTSQNLEGLGRALLGACSRVCSTGGVSSRSWNGPPSG